MPRPVLCKRDHALVNRGAGVSPAAIPAESPKGEGGVPDQHMKHENWRWARTPAPRSALIRSMDAALQFAVWLGLGTLVCNGSLTAAPPLREAPNMAAAPVNQLAVAGNACGPAALLNALRFGNKDWQRASNTITGKNDRERVLTVIREICMRPSKSVPGRPRWSRRGVNVADLRDMANEMTAAEWLPQVREEMCYLKPRETPEKLLQRVHGRLETSLAKGLPPILSIRRHALRLQPGQAAQWTTIDAHFITITAVPRRLEKNARSFSVRYIDPWGGRFCEGEIRIPAEAVLPDAMGRPSCLQARFPQTSVGEKLVRRGEKTVVVAAAVIGRW